MAPKEVHDKAADIAAYVTKYKIPVEDAIKIFAPSVGASDAQAAQAAEQEAKSSRTGGTANPAARAETPDLSQMKKEDLEKRLREEIASGFKV
jgi:hypothetical protein